MSSPGRAVSPGPAIFALGASRPFGLEVARRLGVEPCAHEEREFEDGEHKARSLVSVRGRDAYVIHSLAGGAGESPNDRLVRLLFFVGSLRDASAARVTAVVPYLAYARKDRKSRDRDPVATRYVAALFEAVGADCVVTLDVHNLAAFQNAFRCRAENLEAAATLAARVAALVGGAEASVVSPDAGGLQRAERFRVHLERVLGRPVASAFVEKHRSEGVVRSGQLVGEVHGKVAIVVDDIVASGRTLQLAAAACLRHGANRVIAAASHGLFSGDAGAVLGASDIERIVVTDSVAWTPGPGSPLAARVERVSVAPLVAEAIRALHGNGSITRLAERAVDEAPG